MSASVPNRNMRALAVLMALAAALAALSGCAKSRRTPDDTLVILIDSEVSEVDPRYEMSSAQNKISRNEEGGFEAVVALFDSTSGKQVRQLTYPPSGTSDTALTWSAGTLAWVRTAGASACVYELDRLDNGKPSTVASSTKVRYGWPVLSPSADGLAFRLWSLACPSASACCFT